MFTPAPPETTGPGPLRPALAADEKVVRFGMPQDFTKIYTFVTAEYSQGARDYFSLINGRGGVINPIETRNGSLYFIKTDDARLYLSVRRGTEWADPVPVGESTPGTAET